MATTTHPLVESLKKAVKRLNKAQVDLSWAGAGSPDETSDLELELLRADTEYQRIIALVNAELTSR